MAYVLSSKIDNIVPVAFASFGSAAGIGLEDEKISSKFDADSDDVGSVDVGDVTDVAAVVVIFDGGWEEVKKLGAGTGGATEDEKKKGEVARSAALEEGELPKLDGGDVATNDDEGGDVAKGSDVNGEVAAGASFKKDI